MSCQTLTELVTDYVEGRLSLANRMQFKLHIGMCKNCREYVRQLELTRETLGELPPTDIPPEVQESLLDQFRNWKSDPDEAE